MTMTTKTIGGGGRTEVQTWDDFGGARGDGGSGIGGRGGCVFDILEQEG
jgi:hypothetical protein